MPKKIIYTTDSSKCLIQIMDYISKDSLLKAEKFIYEITIKIRNLSKFPKLGKLLIENNYVYLVNQNYLVYYKIENSKIFILSVKHVKNKEK